MSILMEYYKHGSSVGDEKHVKRLINDDENVFKELSHNNFYRELKSYDQVRLEHEKAIGKKIAKNANTLIDIVVSFSNDQFQEIVKNNPKYKDDVAGCFRMYMMDIQKKFGFEPLSMNFHMDEGRYEDGKFINNYHAHVLFYNYDFKKNCAPLRKFKNNKKAFRFVQDITAKNFESLGFIRGVSKKITKKEHQKKGEFVREVLKKKEEEIKEIGNKINNLNQQHSIYLAEIENRKIIMEKKHDQLRNNSFIEKEKESFKEIQKLIESDLAVRLYKRFKSLDNNAVSRPIFKFGEKLLNKIKPLYNTLHWVFMGRPSPMEVKAEKDVLKGLEEQFKQSKSNSRKIKGLKNMIKPKPPSPYN